MKVLVTGADGFIGSLLCPALRAAGYHVRCAVRDKSALINPSLEQIGIGNIGPTTDWTEALVDVDVVVHLAARVHMLHDNAQDPLAAYRYTNTLGTQQLARMAADAQVTRMVFTSTLHVNGEYGLNQKLFTEADKPRPTSPYAISKWEAEQALHMIAADSNFDITIVRPPLVYGPGVKGNFLRLMNLAHKGVPLPLRNVKNRRSFISRTNLVDFLIRCIDHPAASGETFLISDNEDVSTAELIRRLARQFHRPARLYPFPESVMRLGASLTGKTSVLNRLLGSLAIDPTKARTLLGWQPVVSMNEELEETARWFLDEKRRRYAV